MASPRIRFSWYSNLRVQKTLFIGVFEVISHHEKYFFGNRNNTRCPKSVRRYLYLRLACNGAVWRDAVTLSCCTTLWSSYDRKLNHSHLMLNMIEKKTNYVALMLWTNEATFSIFWTYDAGSQTLNGESFWQFLNYFLPPLSL